MLVSFMELNPPADKFGEILARYAADPRPGIAEAARLLERSWHQGQMQTPVAARLTPADILRVLGALLDDARARAAFVVLGPEGALMQAFGETRQWELTAVEIARENAARSALRGQVPVGNPLLPERYESALRAVGTALEREAPQVFEILASRNAVVVSGDAGYHRVFSPDELTALLRQAIEQRREAGQ
jgi:hypothetical protein